MATTRENITDGWPGSPTITASGTTAVLIRNTDGAKALYWAITAGDTEPSFDPAQGHIVLPAWSHDASQIGIELADTERLWLANSGGTTTVTVTQGDA